MRLRLANLALNMFKIEMKKANEEKDEKKLSVMTERLIHLYTGLQKDIEVTKLQEKTKEIKVA